ncbi:hypothetical protein NEUTE1DRAFT_42835, partial [Neurospora tetrasperma FGSC 2508]
EEFLVFKKILWNLIDKGFIRAKALALILFVKKLGSSVRIYINYRGINNITFKSHYLLPFIKKTLNAIYYIKVFIKFNIIIAFNRIRIK